MRYLFLFFIISLSPVFGHPFSEHAMEPWGVDTELLFTRTPPSKPILQPSQKICQSMIHFFQNHISPIDGPRSSFYPTSSQYTLDAIIKYGALKGIALGCDRLMRENKDWWIYETKSMHGIDRKLDPVR